MLKLERKNLSEILQKGGPIFQVWGEGKKGGGQKIFPNLRGEPKPYTLWSSKTPVDASKNHGSSEIKDVILAVMNWKCEPNMSQ